MKAVVVYRSVYGSTKKYAEWIAEKIGCRALERDSAEYSEIEDADIIIYGGGLYAGKVNGIEFLTSSPQRFKDKKIVLFTCGLADPAEAENHKNIMSGIRKAVPECLLERAEIFCLRGGIDYSRLGFIHRTMMAMMYKAVKKKGVSAEGKEFIESYGKAVDFTDKEAIEPIVEYVLKCMGTD